MVDYKRQLNTVFHNKSDHIASSSRKLLGKKAVQAICCKLEGFLLWAFNFSFSLSHSNSSSLFFEVSGRVYLFTSMHVFFKVPDSHDAFQAECPAAHKANLTIEEGLPHHQHLK